MTEAARAKVDADPDPVPFVGEDIDVVVARSHRSQLPARLFQERAPVASGHGLPGRVREERVVGGRVGRPVDPPYPEGQSRLDLVAEPFQGAAQSASPAGKVAQAQIGADSGVSTGDVEPDARDAHLVVVRGDATDGHYVAEVTVGHQRGVVGALCDADELRQRLVLVLSEYLHGRRILGGGPGGCRTAAGVSSALQQRPATERVRPSE